MTFFVGTAVFVGCSRWQLQVKRLRADVFVFLARLHDLSHRPKEVLALRFEYFALSADKRTVFLRFLVALGWQVTKQVFLCAL